MKLSDYVIDFLVKQGISHNFEMIGGAIAHLLDSTYFREDIRNVSVHHEQAAAFAAEAYSRVSGNIGLAMATSGPGALNLLTGIGSCYFDSVPCLFITGQVNTYEYKFDRPVRQIGFQETDIISVAQSLTKYAEMITDPHKIRFHLEKAVFLAKNGRPGPVLLDIPMDVQRQDIDPNNLESYFDSQEFKNDRVANAEKTKSKKDYLNIIDAIQRARRPVILVGGGVRIANASDEVEKLVELTGFPVVSSLMGIDAISHFNSNHLGLIGSYGNRYSNMTLANADLILILGSRLDTRQTGTKVETFGREAIKIHVDIDHNELNEKVKVDIAINMNLKDFLIELNSNLINYTKQDLSEWISIIKNYQKLFPTYSPPKDKKLIDPNRFIEKLSEACDSNAIFCLDVGQHQMWASQSIQIKKGQRLLNSGGMGAMGFAIPAAIGAAFAKPDAQIIVIVGDGGIQVNIQELETIVANDLNIKIIVMNNQNLGMVRAFQDLYFEGRQQSTKKGYTAPDFCKIANAYGIESDHLELSCEIPNHLGKAFSKKGAYLLNVHLETDTVVNPKLVVNRPIEDMWPHLDPDLLKKLMIIDVVE